MPGTARSVTAGWRRSAPRPFCAAPEGPEIARVRQALLETPATGLAPLAADVGLTAAAVERRLVELFGLDIAALDRMQRGV